MVDVSKFQRYPHMLVRDILIWERFLEIHGAYFERFDYDIHVGEGVAIDPDWPENIIKAAKFLTTKRIDVIGYRKNETWIIEVKPYASLSALGQLIAYKSLYTLQYKPAGKIYLAVVTTRLAPDLERIYRDNDIKVYEMGEIEGVKE